MLRYVAPFVLALGVAACGDDGAVADNDAGADARMQTAEADDAATDAGETDAEAGGLGQTPPVNLVQDVAAGPVGLANAVVDGGDSEAFVRNAALSGMYEIQAGQIALDKAGSPEVRELGQTLINDHTQLNAAIEQAAADAGLDIAMPQTLDERRQGLIDNLMAASDADFDAAFLHQQEAAHLEAITLLESYESRGDALALVTAAQEAQPVIRRHLEMIHDRLGAAVDGQ